MSWREHFERGLSYENYLQRYGEEEHRRRWAAMHARIRLTEPQQILLAGFRRQMPVLVMAGAWCGDCVDQCPAFDHFAKAAEVIDLRFVDRDDSPLQEELAICGGARVPAVVFLSEDHQFVSRHGDRTLTRYRQIAAEQVGEACSTGLVAPEDDVLAAVVQEWLDEFERVQLILRTSPRLRKKHGD